VNGGILLLSYNALPGCAAIIPLQKFLKLYSERRGAASTPQKQLELAAILAMKLRDSGGDFFSGNPLAAKRLEELKNKNPSYLCHEYLVENWYPFSFADTAKVMSSAGLNFVGSANLIDHNDGLLFHPQELAILSSIDDEWIRETARDVIRNQTFRADVYVKGYHRITKAERDEIFRDYTFIRLMPVVDTPETVSTRAGQIQLRQPPFDRLLSALNGTCTKTVPELCAEAEIKIEDAVAALVILIQLGIIYPVQDQFLIEAAIDKCMRLNAEVVGGTYIGQKLPALASPITGTGVPFLRPQHLFLLALRSGSGSPDQWASFVWNALRNERASHERRSQEGAALLRQAIVFEKYLPIFSQLKVLQSD
jgi:hypothetical protein